MQFYQIVKNRKGMGLTDFFSILAFALILIVFYLFTKLTLGNTTFELTPQSSTIEDSLSLISILRTSVVVDGKELTISELVAMSNLDLTKKDLLEKKLVEFIDESFGASRCVIICINKRELRGSGCGNVQIRPCLNNIILVPNYDGKSTEVSFKSHFEPEDIQYTPLK